MEPLMEYKTIIAGYLVVYLCLQPKKWGKTLKQTTVAINQIIKFTIHEYFSYDLDGENKQDSGFSRKIRRK
jgi:hypothetical protein